MNPEAVQAKSKLDLGEIKIVAVIDDVFDFPDMPHLNHGEGDDFFSALDGNDTAQAELSRLSMVISRDIGLEIEQLQILWRYVLSGEESELAKLCKSTLFVNILQDWNQVMRFCNYLETELNLSTIKVGAYHNFDEFLSIPIKLIFIDYFLGTDILPMITDSSTAVRIPAKERSIDFVKNIKANPSDNTKPFVILMSSKDISPDMRSQFRDETGWLEGMFYFIPKSGFNQKQQLSILLGVLAKSLPTGYKIQSFVDVLADSLKRIEGKFLQDIRTLSLTDYAYIQKLSLLSDGHPLGDYMFWLYSSYLNYLLFEDDTAVPLKCSEINKMSFKDLPTVQVAPSQQLVKIYKSALFDDHVGELADHPLAVLLTTPESSPDDTTPNNISQPRLQLGDLFINAASNNVIMVINAQCDLAFSPNADRPFPQDNSIIFIQGELQQLKEPIRDITQVRTELFEYNQIKYRILWKIKQIVAYPYNEVAGFLKKGGFTRLARLRQLYALEIQNAFASNLTRIGMPVPPPAYQPVQVSIFAKGKDGEHQSLANLLEGIAYLAKMKDNEQCILTLSLVMDAMGYTMSLVAKMAEELEALDPNQQGYEKRKERLARRRDEINEAIENYQEWLQLLTPFELKDGDEKVFANLPVKICRRKTIEGKYNHQQAILINLTEVL